MKAKTIDLSDGTRWLPVPGPELPRRMSAEEADAVAAALAPRVGKKVLLYGGGGPGAFVVRLQAVQAERRVPAQAGGARAVVRARVDGPGLPSRPFEPILGSWWIATAFHAPGHDYVGRGGPCEYDWPDGDEPSPRCGLPRGEHRR